MKILVFLMMVSSISFSQKTEELEKLLLDISRWQRDVSSLQEDAQKDLNVSVDSLIISLKLINSKEYKEELIFKESCCNSFTSKDFDRLERFYTKFFRDLGLINFGEPALSYFTQGLVYGSDGEKMSKSRGNVVEPLEMIKKYGADSLRLYLISNSAPDKNFYWEDNAVQSGFKFILSIFNFAKDFKSNNS